MMDLGKMEFITVYNKERLMELEKEMGRDNKEGNSTRKRIEIERRLRKLNKVKGMEEENEIYDEDGDYNGDDMK